MNSSSTKIEAIVKDEIRRADENRPTPKKDWEPGVDSLVMATIVMRIEGEFGIEVPDTCIPPGGVDDVQECINFLTSKILEVIAETPHAKQPVTVS